MLMLVDDLSQQIVPAIIMLVVGFVFIFALRYLTTPSYIEYGDQRSRIIYCAIYAAFLAIVLALGFAILPVISWSYGIIVALVAGLILALAFTIVQAFLTRYLVAQGIIKMRNKPIK